MADFSCIVSSNLSSQLCGVIHQIFQGDIFVFCVRSFVLSDQRSIVLRLHAWKEIMKLTRGEYSNSDKHFLGTFSQKINFFFFEANRNASIFWIGMCVNEQHRDV